MFFHRSDKEGAHAEEHKGSEKYGQDLAKLFGMRPRIRSGRIRDRHEISMLP